MREMDDKTQKDAVAESDKFVMAVEESKNSASKKRKKK